MASRRKVGNLMALTVLNALVERPMHPYELASVLRARGKEHSIRIKWGSLYTVMQNLEKHGFVEATGTVRAGRRPERTVYAITDAGRAEVKDWLRELLAVPERQFPPFEAALAELAVLSPDEVLALLDRRVAALEAEIEGEHAMRRGLPPGLPRLFVLEAEFRAAMLAAEADWARSLARELREGTFPDVHAWRTWHETGEVTGALAELAQIGGITTDEEDGDPDS